jgi:type IV pilus assembly protein PilC
MPFMLICLMLIVVLVYKAIQANKLDALLMRIRIFFHAELAALFHNLGFLLSSGIPMEKALLLSVQNIRNICLKQKFFIVQKQVVEGESCSQALKQIHNLPPETIAMLEIGESAGALGPMLLNIAAVYESGQQEHLKRVMALLEPVLTLAVGLIVAVVALTLFLPILNMISQIQ